MKIKQKKRKSVIGRYRKKRSSFIGNTMERVDRMTMHGGNAWISDDEAHAVVMNTRNAYEIFDGRAKRISFQRAYEIIRMHGLRPYLVDDERVNRIIRRKLGKEKARLIGVENE